MTSMLKKARPLYEDGDKAELATPAVRGPLDPRHDRNPQLTAGGPLAVTVAFLGSSAKKEGVPPVAYSALRGFLRW